MKKKSYAVYLIIVAVICLVPSVGLLFGGGEVSSDEDSTAAAPQLVNDDGSFNVGILSDAGDWFDNHFAFRNEVITAASEITTHLFGVSSADNVVYGKDGWLFYGDSLDDYQGTNQLNGRQLFDIAHSAKLVQDYCEGRGIDFAFAIAPNKNTLYGQYMPYYYQNQQVATTSYERIKAYLEQQGVNYVDLQALFAAQNGVLYHQRDSHWNNLGASLVADDLLTSLGKSHVSYDGASYSTRADFTGDLDKMIFPAATTPESEVYFERTQEFSYVTPVESNFDPKIQTTSDADDASGSLVMYRDSFGNSLLPFMAEAYSDAYFSRAVPYQLTIDLTEHNADTLIIERAQRFMPDMAENAPIMPAPLQMKGTVLTADYAELNDVTVTDLGDYTEITGSVPTEGLADDARLFVQVNGSLVYEAFGTSDADAGQEGFQLTVPTSVLNGSGDTYGLYIDQ